MTNEEIVKNIYPEAFWCEMVTEYGMKHRIESGYTALSDWKDSEIAAWEDAAQRIKGTK
jgi:hypothetical protein